MMFTAEELASLDKEALPERAKALDAGEIAALVDLLNEKGDVARYHALLLLQNRSADHDEVYPYMDIFLTKLKSENSYQRNIGAQLSAANARWDGENKLDAAIGDYLALLDDEKPITVRQCLQPIGEIIRHKPALRGAIARRLLAFDITGVKETMRKSILLDILTALAELTKYGQSGDIEEYLSTALAGGILDKKAARDVERLFRQP